MNTSILIATFGILLEIVVLVIGGVWAVGKIQSTTMVLNNTITHLETTIVKLQNTIDLLVSTQHNLETRLAVLEAKDVV